MLIYIALLVSLFTISIFFSFLKTNSFTKYVPLGICFVLVLLFSSFKSNSIGMDTQAYHDYFTYIAQHKWESLNELHLEKGYVLFSILVSYFTQSFTGFNFAFYFIVYANIAFFCASYSNKPSLVFSFIIGMFLQFALTAYRQALAISIVCLGVALFFQIKQKYVRMILPVIVILLAFYFHKSSIICLSIPIVYIIVKKIGLRFDVCAALFLICLVGARPLYYLIATIMGTYYAPFSNNSLSSTAIATFLGFILCYCFTYSKFVATNNYSYEATCLSPSSNKLGWIKTTFKQYLCCDEPKNKDCYDSALILTVFASCMMLFALVTTVFTRMYYFFIPFIAYLAIETIDIRKNNTVKLISFIIIALFICLYFVITLLRSDYYSSYVPYETIF